MTQKTTVKRSPLRAFTIWLCSLALLAPFMPAFAAATVTTTTTVAASVNPVAVGSATVLTASVTGTAPTGTVTFKNGTATLGTGTLGGSGNTRTATYSATFSTVAANSVTAVYAGDTTNKTSTSAALTVNSSKASPSNTLTSSLNPSTSGTSVTLTSTVVGFAPTGSITFMEGSTTLGTGTLSGTGNTRTATLATTTLATASHAIKAVYAGDSLNNAVTSTALNQVVNQKTSTTTLASSLNPSTSGTSVTFTATVTGNVPTGTVTFKDGSTTLGTGTVASGIATYTTSTLSVATHSITALYAGDTNNTSSTSSAVSQVVNRAATSTTLTSNASPSFAGSAVTFTAAIAGNSPSGTVTFKDGASTTLGTGTVSGGIATYTTSSLSVATHSIAASYSGDTNNLASTSSAMNQVVNAVASTTTLSSSLNPSVYWDNVTFTANVMGQAPSGSVVFKDGTTTLGTAVVNSGVAVFAIQGLSNATHSITATYSGDANNTTGLSGSISQVVKDRSTTIINSTGGGSSNFGDSVTFAIQVGNSTATPTGGVTLKDGSITLATLTLAANGRASYTTSALSVGTHTISVSYPGDTLNLASNASQSYVVYQNYSTTMLTSSNLNGAQSGTTITFSANVIGQSPGGTVTFKDGSTVLGTTAVTNGTATYSTAALNVALHSITAIYSGDINNLSSTSDPINQTVSQVVSTTALSSSLNPAPYGAALTLTATVTGLTPSGIVTFYNGNNAMGTGNVANGVATFTTSTLAGGPKNLTASYAGDANNASSTSSTLSQVVTKQTSSTVVSVSANPITAGAPVTLTATVSGSNPSGTVDFSDNVLGWFANAPVVNGVATFITTALTNVSTHSISAFYNGDGGNTSSPANTVSLVVNSAATTTNLISSANPVASGTAITFTATVNGNAPSGTVTFNDGASAIGTGSINSGGVATYTTNALTVATHSITAVFAGDANNAASTSPAISEVITPAIATSASTISSSANPAGLGTAITLSASITGNNPGGTVTFNDGASAIGNGTINNGVATLSISTLAAGTHSITAVYAGDSNNAASTSAPLSEIITSALASTPMTWQYGYDAMGRPTITTDPYGKAVYTYYDSLGRPIQTQQAVGADQSITQFAYNAADSLTKVTDPRNLQTTYSPTGVGTVTAQTSPDTGTATATYDVNRNLTSKTDARGKLTTYSYDNMNRLTTVHYASGTDITMEYDGGANRTPAAAGGLTKLTDESGQTSYTYDSAGRLSSKTQVTSGKSFVVGYTWGDSGSALDKLIAITYPSGSQVNYAYDAQGAVSAVTVNTVNANGVGFSASASPLLSNITLNPAGQVTGWSWASGKTQILGYDQYGQPSSYKLGDAAGTGASAGTTRTIGYDGAGRIMAYSHVNNGVSQPGLDQSFAYDDLTRLVSANLGSSTIQYNYDANGNRSSKVISGTAYNNTVSPSSNKLTQIQDVGGANPVQYDAAGNVTNDGVNGYTYSDRGRLSSAATPNGTISYRYNGFEQRTYKSGPNAIIPTGAAYYVYNEAGQLLGEYDANGVPIYETVYLGATPVGVLKQTGTAVTANIATSIYNVYADHLATPRVITRNTDEAIVWRWDAAEAFGATAPDQNPNNLGTFTFNQRLPGQVFDAETGLFQNWNREYNARLGRYIQSDPIGLAGGINTFAYVGGNPLGKVDSTGLAPYDSDAWTGTQSGYVNGATNCYGYALDKMVAENPGKSDLFPRATCESLMANAKSDGLIEPGQSSDQCGGTCPTGYHKIQIFLDDRNIFDRDYHVYRQDDDGGWSHKRGRGGIPTRTDAAGKTLMCPNKSDRNFGDRSYQKSCGTLCAPETGTSKMLRDWLNKK